MAAVMHPTNTISSSVVGMSTKQQQQQGPPNPVLPLRRAVYVHVSDLTSSYNIDHAMLEEELARVKAEQQERTHPMTISTLKQQHHHHSLDTTTAASAATATSDTTSTSTSLGGVPTELDTSVTQRRLQPPRTGYNLCVVVGKVTMVVDKNRVDGTRVRLAEVEVGDETGTVSLRARDDQIDILEEVSLRSGPVVLRNCTIELYQGKHIRLAVTKWGKLTKYPDQIASTPPPPSKINRDRNFSLIDLSKVASEMVSLPSVTSKDTENQANRQQPPSHTSHGGGPSHTSHGGGRGRGRRPQGSSRTKPTPPASPHFGDIVSSVTYAATGLHGYGGIVDPTASPYMYPGAPPPRQHDNNPQRQQKQQQQQQQPHYIMHQRFDMQQQQHHHHHHHRMHLPTPPMYPSPDRGMGMHSSPMISPTGAIPPTSSFGLPPTTQSSPFMVPIPSSSTASPTVGSISSSSTPTQKGRYHPQQLQPQQQQPTTLIGRAESPGKMNPQAPTFDPSAFRK